MWEKKHENNSVISKFRPGNFAFLKKKEFDCIESYSAIKTILRLSSKYRNTNVEKLITLYPSSLEALLFYKEKLEDDYKQTTALKNYIGLLSKNKYSESNKYGDRALKELIHLDNNYKKNALNSNRPYLIQDYRHIISSSSFRRLQDKAQVYSLEEKDFVRTRLTHSIEVASIAEDIARNIDFFSIFSLNMKSNYSHNNYFNDECTLIVRIASLIHDIGNPPFGHYGEDVINSFFGKKLKLKKILNMIPSKSLQRDLLNFDGNAQSLRIVDKIQYFGNKCGLLLPASILGSIIKYPYGSEVTNNRNGKLGYFQSERKLIEFLEIFGTFSENVRNPLSLILEAADDISYITSDLEDAIHKKYIKRESFSKLESELGKNLSKKINKNYDDAIVKCFIDHDRNFEEIMRVIIADLKNELINDVATTFKSNYNLIIKKGIIINPKKQIYYDLLRGFYKKGDKLYKDKNDTHIYVNRELVDELSGVMRSVYKNNEVVLAEISGKNAIEYLLEEYFISIIDKDTELNCVNMRYENSKNRYFDKLLSLISTDFIKTHHQELINNDIYDEKEWKHYCKLRLIIDYISGMTDNYIIDLYNKIKGI